MIVSHKYKFIFVKAIKVAGTSLEVSISPYCGENDIITMAWPRECSEHVPRNHDGFDNHMEPIDIRKTIGRTWDDYYKFSIVRNPYDMVASNYFWEKKKASPSFPDFVKEKQFFVNEVFYFTLPLDFYIRFENLQSDYDKVCEKVGIPIHKLVHSKKSIHNHYSEYYDEETKDIVANSYKRTIEKFGYEFERE